MNIKNLSYFFASSLFYSLYAVHYDLTLIGTIKFADSLGRLPIGIIDCLKNDIKINVVPVNNWVQYADVSKEVQEIVQNRTKRSSSDVSLLLMQPWYPNFTPADLVPKDSTIKIACSVIESTNLPSKWVTIFNSQFDALILPDEWLVEVYKNAGVKKPLFVLPHILYLEDFLSAPEKKRELSKPFRFGMSAGFFPYKNHELLADAFAQEFGNSEDVELIIHSRNGNNPALQKKVGKSQNIELLIRALNNQAYQEFLYSLDCYVLISKGEGFSITPREALAMGVPCILTYNTAHKTICDTGFVKSVKAEIIEPAYWPGYRAYLGNFYNCSIEDVRKAMRDVYENYDYYADKAKKGREWVKQYLHYNLRAKYLNLVKPKKVILGDKNIIEDDFIMTDSPELYQKYLSIMSK